jgi:DNA polymerase-3 subunit gamma/tau
MAYIALYRKWRPKSFEDVVGQSHITETLQKAIDTDKVAHAYLFSGPRGTGKTSTAKIFARAMNCVHGPTSHPCNECEICRHILSGESMDVVEIDAASNRSIEDIRTLRETIKFMPAEGHKKIYIIDEVHMLTTEAFNALLKTLEEPPAHVIFILATTEPERIPMTILSRCQRYEFRRITSADIADRLMYVAEQEHIGLTKGAAHILAVQADGGMRDALSMLDQCVGNADGQIDEGLVRDLLGLIGRDWLFSLSDAVFQGRGSVVIKAVDDVIRMGKEPQIILTELVEHLRAIMLYQADPHTDTLAAYADSLPQLATQAESVAAEQVFAVLNVLQQAMLTAKNSPVPRVAVEMGFLMASRPMPAAGADLPVGQSAVIPDGILDRLLKLEQAVFHGGAVPGKSEAAKRKEYIPMPDEDELPGVMDEEAVPFPDDEYTTPQEHTAPSVRERQSPKPVDRGAVTEPERRQERPQSPAPAAAQTTEPSPSGASSVVPSAEYQQVWQQVCDILGKKLKKPGVQSCVRTGRVLYIGGGEAAVAYKTPFLVKRANREDYFRFVDEALEMVLGGSCHMKGFLEGSPDVAEYEKKNAESGITSRPAEEQPLPKEEAQPEAAAGVSAEASLPHPPVSEEPPSLRPVLPEEMTAADRALLEPLLKTVGDCNIYIEDKP